MGRVIEIVRDDRGYDALETEWRSLFESGHSATTPLKWAWMREWWRIFGPIYGKGPGGLYIITIRSSGKLVGILPLYLHAAQRGWGTKTLRFISTGESIHETTYPEYLNLIYNSEYLDFCLGLISAHLFSSKVPFWNELNLGILAENSPLSRMVTTPLKTIPGALKEQNHISYRAHIGSGFATYLNSTSTSTRQHYRRLFKQTNIPGLEFTVATSPLEAKSFLVDLIKLHQRRWNESGKQGAFSSPRIVTFHNALIEKLIPNGETLLTKLAIAGCPVAVIYGFITKGKFDFYQSGTDVSRGDLKSPGILAHLLTMEHLSKGGVHTYDFLVGQDSYKERLANSKITTCEVKLVRPGVRSTLSATLDICKRASTKVQSLIAPN